MLSILIPTYNYKTLHLAKVLHEQATKENIVFEILVADDTSDNKEIVRDNEAINLLANCSYFINSENLGRAKNRNLLALKAKYSWVLFMDCDTLPIRSSFIKNYINLINQNTHEVFYGGIDYEKENPNETELLRWVYGKKREAIVVSEREKKPYNTTLVSNLVIKKQILLSIPFHSNINEYGYEDLVFTLELKKNKIKICHIENPAYHLNLENSVVFLEKNLRGIKNLNYLIKNKIIAPNETSLSVFYSKLFYFKLDKFVLFCFNVFKSKMKKNLLSKNPSLLVFDLYKLGYFCSLNHH